MARKRQTRSGDRLREFDELFNLFVENVRDYAIFMTDANGSAVSWNAGVERLLGYSEKEFLGTSLTTIYTPEDVSSGAAAREIAAAGEKGRSEDERWHLRKDGSRFWASGVLTALREDGGRLRGFAKVMRDITERKLAEEERKQLLQREQEARQAAEGATRVRDQFLATISHELRTPLNAILGWARILEDQTLDPARVKQAVETISRNAVLQSRLIDDLLDISRILADRATIERSPVDFLSIIQGSVESLSPNALEKDVIVECRLRPLESPVDGDPRRLQQIVWNLLSNAIKFTPDGGRVSIDIEQTGAGAVLTVSDTGIGIPPEFLSRLFDPFSQADMSTERTHGGLGLGLSIVRHLVEQHGGTVHAESGGTGQGSTFTVTLPLATARIDPTPGGARETDLRPSLNTVNVLVVDDNRDSRDVTVAALELAGASVRTADTVANGLAAIAEACPNVLLCDLGLPGEDGFGLIEKVRALSPEQGGNVPAAALTAYTRPEDRLRALQSGFQIHLSKPVDPAELVAAVAALAGKSMPGDS